MPNLDDELRRRMQRAGRRVGTDGVEGRLHQRRAHKQITQKAGRGVLAVAVLAGSAFGVAGLNRAFRGDRAGSERGTGSGTIGFVRLFDTCGGLDAAAASLWFEIVTVDVATGEQRIVPIHVDYPGEGRRAPAPQAPEFSPDGTKVAWRDRLNGRLYVSDVATGATTPVAGELRAGSIGWSPDVSSAGDPHWSPDGSTILFQVDDTSHDGQLAEGESSPSYVYTAPVDGSEATRLTGGRLPVWTDEGLIAFMRISGNAIAPPMASFYTMDADGSHIQKRYEAPGDVPIGNPEWSPDGTQVVADADLHGTTDIYSVDLTLRTALRLTDDPARDASPSWSSDGSMIAFETGRWGTPLVSVSPQQMARGHSEIAVMNADGSDVRRLTNDCWDDFFPTWLPNDATVRSLPVWSPSPDGTPAPPELRIDGIDGPVCAVQHATLRVGDAGVADAYLYRLAESGCPLEDPQHLALVPPPEGATWPAPMPGCDTCNVLAVIDIGRDGTDELALASTTNGDPKQWTVRLFVPRIGSDGWELAPVELGSPQGHLGLPSRSGLAGRRIAWPL